VTFSPRNLFLAAARERERELGLLRHWRGRLEQQATKKTTRTTTTTTTRHSHGGRTEHIHRNLDPDAAATLYQQLFCVLSSSSFSSVTHPGLLLLLHSSPITSSVCNFFFFFAAYYNIWYPCAPQIDRSSMPHTLLLFSTGLYCSCGCLLIENNFKKKGIR
jgi:hypothetical protein